MSTREDRRADARDWARDIMHGADEGDHDLLDLYSHTPGDGTFVWKWRCRCHTHGVASTRAHAIAAHDAHVAEDMTGEEE